MLLFVSSSGHGKRTPVAAFNRQGRGGQGVRGMRVTESRGTVVAAFTVDSGAEILVFSSAGNIVRMGVDEISEQGRDATGVRVARLDEGDTVVAVAPRARSRTERRDARRRGRRALTMSATPARAKRTDPWRAPRPCSRAFPRSRQRPRAEEEAAAKRVASPRQVFERRYVQTIRSVDLWSVLKVAICFYLCALIVMLVAGVMLWWIASAAGVVSSVESFVGELVNNKDFRLLSWEVLRAATLIGLVVVCLLTVITVLAAAFYNLFSELLGGIEVTVVEQEELSDAE